MESRISIGITYLFLFFLAFTPMVWASYWYNKGAYSVSASAINQMALYITPLLIPAFRGFQLGVNHKVYLVFFAFLFPLEWFSYHERDDLGWLYLIAQVPLIWLFSLYAIFSLLKIKRTK